MGEIAEMMLDGTLDYETGEYLGKAVGFPRTKRRRYTKSNSKHLNGLMKYLSSYDITHGKATRVIRNYAEEKGYSEGLTLKQIAKEIQKDFNGFRRWVLKRKHLL